MAGANGALFELAGCRGRPAKLWRDYMLSFGLLVATFGALAATDRAAPFFVLLMTLPIAVVMWRRMARGRITVFADRLEIVDWDIQATRHTHSLDLVDIKLLSVHETTVRVLSSRHKLTLSIGAARAEDLFDHVADLLEETPGDWKVEQRGARHRLVRVAPVE